MPLRDSNTEKDGIDRRSVLKKAGVAGSLGVIAGCLGDEEEPADHGRDVEEDLPEERRVGELEFLSSPESYNPSRFRHGELTMERVNEAIGTSIEQNVYTGDADLRAQGEFHLDSVSLFSESGGDPDFIIYDKYHSEGGQNFGSWSNEEYDQLAEEQHTTYDVDERQALVYEAQEKVKELGWEFNVIYEEWLYPWNSNVVDPDSLVIDGRLGGTWVTWTNMEPAAENETGEVVTNGWSHQDRMNPWHPRIIGVTQAYVVNQVVDGLVRFDEEYNQINWVADDIHVVDDTTVTVEISDEFTFHDGEQLTVDDVLYSYNLMLETDPPTMRSFVQEPLDSIEQTGDWEVTFHLSQPTASFITSTFWITPIIPQHDWERKLADTGNEDTPWEMSLADDYLMGSGPFEVEDYTPEEVLRLKANKDHPIAPPNIEYRTERYFDTQPAELQALVNGEYGYLDFWLGDNDTLIETAEENDHIDFETAVPNIRESTWANTDPHPPHTDEVNPFAAVEFRNAVDAIIQQDLQPIIIEELYRGFGERANSPITPLIEFWHNPDVFWYESGEETAVEILSDAGWQWDEEGNIYFPEDFEYL